MTEAEAVFRKASKDLRAQPVRWALIGALAVGLRTEPRFTRDVDVAVAVATDAEAEQLIFGLQQIGYTVFAGLEQDATGRLATVRLLPAQAPSETAVLDLLFASSGIEVEIVAAAEELEVVPGVKALVATTGHLVALKLLSAGDHRLHDFGDLQALVSVATAGDLDQARHAIGLITERGYNRDRDLPAALDDALSKWR